MRVAGAAWVQGLLGLTKARIQFPILVVNARQFGRSVPTHMPRTVYDLMDLYPQGAKGRPSLPSIPFKRTGGLEWLPTAPGLFP